MLERVGVKEVLVIDLALVGTMKGPPVRKLRKLAGKVKVDLIAGGGVRDVNDILKIAKTGVKGVLVASALHQGAITRKHLLALKAIDSGKTAEIRYVYEEPAVTVCGLLLVKLEGNEKGALELLKLIRQAEEEGNATISILIEEEMFSLRMSLPLKKLREKALRLALKMGQVVKHTEWGQ